jgi:thiamine pyrophosphokinase
MKCVIIANGSLKLEKAVEDIIKGAKLVVCADGGARHMKALGLLPGALIGDFDSLSPEDKLYFEKKSTPIIRFNSKKDRTDTDLAISWAIENGADDITLIGVTGTRLDHTFCNILMLKRMIELNIPCRIVDTHNEIHLVVDRLEIKGKPGELLSIIPICEKATGVTLEGLEYPLSNATMNMGSSLGTSNAFIKDTAVISINSGILAVFKSKD